MKLFSSRSVYVIAAGALSLAMVSSGFAQADKVVSKDTAKASPAVPKLKPQTKCPIQGDAINKKLFVDADGKRIYVCCEACLPEVKKDPQAAIKKLEVMGQEPISIAMATSEKKETPAVSGYYTCPMHPEIHDAAAGKCPKCGMNLEFKKEAPAAKTPAKMDHSNMKM